MYNLIKRCRDTDKEPYDNKMDYKGEYILKFEAIPSSCDARSLAYCKFPYKVGDRVAQMYLEKVVQFEFEEVDELTTSERGTGGFGSTNK